MGKRVSRKPKPIITEFDDETGEWEISDDNDESILEQMIDVFVSPAPKHSRPASWYATAIEPQPESPALAREDRKETCPTCGKLAPVDEHNSLRCPDCRNRVALGFWFFRPKDAGDGFHTVIERPEDFPEWFDRYEIELAALLKLMVAGACADGKNYGNIKLTPKLLEKFAGALVARKLVPSLDVALNMEFREAVELAKTIPDAFDWVAKEVDKERAAKEKAERAEERQAESQHELFLENVEERVANRKAKREIERKAETPQPAIEPKAEKSDIESGQSKITWQQAASMMEGYRLKGEPFTSQGDFATRIGCSKATVNKAIEKTASLREWAEKQTTSTINAVHGPILKGIASTRGADPSDICEDDDIDVMTAYLLDQAGPDERARINAMSPADRRKLAQTAYRDPDREEQAARYRRAKPKSND